MQTIGDVIAGDDRGLIVGRSGRWARPHPGKDASPEAIIQWADAEVDAMFARLGQERPIPPDQCPACRGRGYTGEGDTSEWCTAPGCTLGRSSRTCPTCGNIASNPREFEIPCTCGDHEQEARARRARAGLPAKYHGWTFASWWKIVQNNQPKEIHDTYSTAGKIARRIADGEPLDDGRTGLLLLGATGRQKSGLAAAIAEAFGDRYTWIAWAGWCDFLNGLRNAGGDEVAERRRAAASPLLIIDDLGADELSTSYRRRVLLDLLEQRRPTLPIVVTSMYGLTDLSERFDEAAIGRLIESCIPITLSGVDARRAQRKEQST